MRRRAAWSGTQTAIWSTSSPSSGMVLSSSTCGHSEPHTSRSGAAAIGYCAGGGFALEQARAGADFKALVVFHVTNPNPVVPGTPCNIKGRVLAIHGSDDPITPKPMMDALEDELTKAKVDWHIVTFGRGVHSFCDPTVNAGPTRYDEKLCRTSYMLMRDFFAETL